MLLPIILYGRGGSWFADSIGGIKNIIKSFLFGSTFKASWYIMASIIGIIIIYVLSAKFRNRYIFIISGIVFGIVTLCSSYSLLFAGVDVINKLGNAYSEVFGNPVLSFPASLIWITCGKCFAEGKIKIAKRIGSIILILSCIGLYAEWWIVKYFSGTYSNDSYFMLLSVCIYLFNLFLGIKSIYIRNSLKLRECSTVIYAAHASVIPILSRIFGISNSITLYVMTVCICIVCYAMIKFILKRNKMRIFKLLKYAY